MPLTEKDKLEIREIVQQEVQAANIASGKSRLLTIRAAADYLDVSTWTIRRLIDGGALKCKRIGRVIRLDPADVMEYAEGKARKEE